MSHRPPEDSTTQQRQAEAKLTAHRGMATWGERLVTLDHYRQATATAGRRLSAPERLAERQRFLAPADDPTPSRGPSAGLPSLVVSTATTWHWRRCSRMPTVVGPRRSIVWGTLAGLVPTRTRSGRSSSAVAFSQCRATTRNHWPVVVMIATAATPIHVTITLPRSLIATPPSTPRRSSGPWVGSLPRRRRVRVGTRELLLVHGSPRRNNEFLFHSTSPISFLEALLDQERCAGVLCTHTGLHWHRHLPSGRDVVNVGVIGRPANDGDTAVWYAMLEDRDETLGVDLLRLPYDHRSLAKEMRRELLPQEFIDTILTGWWTTCLEVLPARERASSRY